MSSPAELPNSRAQIAAALPIHYELSRGQAVFSAVSIATALVMLAAVSWRVVTQIDLWQWWMPLAWLGGMAGADFGSGLVHWAADTWGRDDLPVVGRRLLVPFRVHHVNPDDLLRRSFVDANGDVAFVSIVPLATLLVLPLDSAWTQAIAIAGVAFCGVGMWTNQIHQWAHMPAPPAPVRAMQACRLLLARTEHAAHHDRPYDRQYCITTGWCNRPLDAIGFFRRLESAITRLTGVAPRHDDRRYESRYAVPVAHHEIPGA